MSARDFRSTGQIRGAKDGIGHRIKEWMIWAEKRSSAAPNLSRKYTPAEVSRHNTKNDLWIIVDNVIYDVTLFSMYHPGGKEILHKWGGKDCTEEYQRLHGWVDHRTILQGYIIGTVSGGRTTPTRAGITTTPNKPLPSSNSSSNTNKEVTSIFDAAQKIGLFRGVTSTQKDLMIRVASNGDKATGRVSPNARSGISSEDEVLLASLFDELDAQKTGYVLRSQVEQLINALNEGEAMDATTLQRLQSMRSELINRRQFVLLFL